MRPREVVPSNAAHFLSRERVKVYRLNQEGKWDDKGTGHVYVEYLERSEAVGLVVIDEEDNATTLLIHRISADDVYRRQEETIISWKDPEVATDLALSFQESMGCSFIWDQIRNVQGTIPFPSVGGMDAGSRAVYNDFEHSGTSHEEGAGGDIIELPVPELANLPQIVKVVAEVMPFERPRVANLIDDEWNYMHKLAEVFRLCEDLENIEGLHMLYKIVKGLILLNDPRLFEVLFSNEYIMDVVGALEYDPDLPTRQEHRHFLKDVVLYKEAVPIHDPSILSKIHQTYRITYTKDVILPRVLNDQTFSTLNSMILFNHAAVVSSLQSNNVFLEELFEKLGSHETSEQVKKDLMLFVQEFVNLSKHVQAANRSRLFSALVQKGLFDTVTNALQSSDEAVRLIGSDILIVVLSHEPILLRVFLVEQPDHQLFSLLVKGMLTNGEGGLQAQLLEVMRMLLDSETMESQQAERDTFLDVRNVFYEKYMDQLLEALTAGCLHKGNREKAQQLSTFAVAGKLGPVTPETLANICELLCFCVQHHGFKIKYYVMRNNVVEKILRLTRCKEKYLVVAAVRFIRTCVGLKEDFYSRYLVKNNLFEPVIQAFLANGKRYNLLNSAVLELIDFIRKENINNLIVHFVETFGDKLEKIEYVDTYKNLKLKYEQLMEGSRPGSRDAQATRDGTDSAQPRTHNDGDSALDARHRKDERALDKDEEDYFNEDSDDEEEAVSAKGATPSFPSPALAPAVVVNGNALAAVLLRGNSFGLVDYEDEEEDTPVLPNNNHRKGHPSKRTENKGSMATTIEDAPWPQEGVRSPKRSRGSDGDDDVTTKRQKPKEAQDQAGEAEMQDQVEKPEAALRNDDSVSQAFDERDSDKACRESPDANDALLSDANDGSKCQPVGVSASVSSDRCGEEGSGEIPEDPTALDRSCKSNGGESSPSHGKSSLGDVRLDDGTHVVAHGAGVPNEGDFIGGETDILREEAQASPG